MTELKLINIYNYSNLNKYTNRSILCFSNNKYYIGKHWIYYIHFLNSIDCFLDKNKIDISLTPFSQMTEDNVLNKFYTHNKKKITDFNIICELLLLNNSPIISEYKISCKSKKLLESNLVLFDKILCMSDPSKRDEFENTKLQRTEMGGHISRVKEFSPSLFRKPKSLNSLDQIDNRIKYYWKQSEKSKNGVFYETLLNWFCQTIIDFCPEKYITHYCEKYMFSKI